MQWKYYIHIYEDGNVTPIETIPRMGVEVDKRE
jgi:hypothetical protein